MIRTGLIWAAVLVAFGVAGCGNSTPSNAGTTRAALVDDELSISAAFPLSPPGEPVFRTDSRSRAIGSGPAGYLLVTRAGNLAPWVALQLSSSGAILTTTPLAGDLTAAAVVWVGDRWLVVYRGSDGVYALSIDSQGQASAANDITSDCACGEFTSLAWDGTRALLLLDAGRAVFIDATGELAGAPFVIADPATYATPGDTSCRAVAYDGTRYAAVCTWFPRGAGTAEVYAYPVSSSGAVGERVFLSEGLIRPGHHPYAIGIAAKHDGFLAVYSMPVSAGPAGNAYCRLLTSSNQGLVAGPAAQVPDMLTLPGSMTSDVVFAVLPTGAGYSVLYQGALGGYYSTQIASDGSRLSTQRLAAPPNLGSASTGDIVPALAAIHGSEILVNWNARAVVYSTHDLSPITPTVTLWAAPPSQANVTVASGGSDHLAAWTELREFGDAYSSFRSVDVHAEHLALDGTLVETSSRHVTRVPYLGEMVLAASGRDYAIVTLGTAAAVAGITIVRSDGSMTRVDISEMSSLGLSPRWPALAGDGEGGYLVVWYLEGGIGANQVRAASISPTGVMSSSVQLPVTLTYGRSSGPLLSFVGDDYVLAVGVQDEAGLSQLVAMRVNRQLEVIVGPNALTDPAAAFRFARMSCAPSNCLLTWDTGYEPEATTQVIRGLRVNRALEPIDAVPRDLATRPYAYSNATSAWDGYRYWVVWLSAPQSEVFELYGLRIGLDGVKLDAEPSLISKGVAFEQSENTVALSRSRPGEILVAYNTPSSADEMPAVRGRLLWAPLPDGATCMEDAQCMSNACISGHCDHDGGTAGAGGTIGAGGAARGGEGGFGTGGGSAGEGGSTVGEAGSSAGEGGAVGESGGGNIAGTAAGAVSTGGESGNTRGGAGGVSDGGGRGGVDEGGRAGSDVGGSGGRRHHRGCTSSTIAGTSSSVKIMVLLLAVLAVRGRRRPERRASEGHPTTSSPA
jgi:hypothetical protein